MGLTNPRLPHVRLNRPRLLPITIAAMSALLVTKTVIMAQAYAEEATSSAQADPPGSVKGSANAQSPEQATTLSAVPQRAPEPVGKATPAPQPPVTDAERTILMGLRRRREALDTRARQLDLREAEMSAADRSLESRLQQLSKLQDKLNGLEASRQHRSEESWSGLVKVYEAMKPHDAASIFDSLDMQVLLQVIDRMQDRRAAPVLAAMQPDRARLVTQMLAEMRTRATAPQDLH